MDAFLHDISWAVGLRNEILTPIFYGFTWLGYTTFFLIALPAAYWAWNKHKITRVAFIVLASAILNAFLKDLWQDPRPDISLWLDPHMDDSYGMPSGHTQIGIIMWLWLAYEIRRMWAWVAAVIIASGIAFSRLYLGVHDVEDVIVGGLIGFATLGLYAFAFTPSFDRWRNLAFPMRFGILVALNGFVLAIWPGPSGGIAAASGLFLAWYAGYAFDGSGILYKPHAALWRRAVVTIPGVIGVIVLFGWLSDLQDAIAPDSTPLAFLNGTIIGVFIVLIVPMAARALGLADRESAAERAASSPRPGS